MEEDAKKLAELSAENLDKKHNWYSLFLSALSKAHNEPAPKTLQMFSEMKDTNEKILDMLKNHIEHDKEWKDEFKQWRDKITPDIETVADAKKISRFLVKSADLTLKLSGVFAVVWGFFSFIEKHK
jgi:hypothetical protein